MSVALTAANKRTLKRLLRTGRWGNESEIVRYGIHLVEREVQEQQKDLWPEPIHRGELARIYVRETEEERETERQLGKASMRHPPEPID